MNRTQLSRIQESDRIQESESAESDPGVGSGNRVQENRSRIVAE